MLGQAQRGHRALGRFGSEVDDVERRGLARSTPLRGAGDDAHPLAFVGGGHLFVTFFPRGDAPRQSNGRSQEHRSGAIHREIDPCDGRVVVARRDCCEARRRRGEQRRNAIDRHAVEHVELGLLDAQTFDDRASLRGAHHVQQAADELRVARGAVADLASEGARMLGIADVDRADHGREALLARARVRIGVDDPRGAFADEERERCSDEGDDREDAGVCGVGHIDGRETRRRVRVEERLSLDANEVGDPDVTQRGAGERGLGGGGRRSPRRGDRWRWRGGHRDGRLAREVALVARSHREARNGEGDEGAE